MNRHPRPAWRNRAVPVVSVLVAVLILTLCTVGAEGPAARIIPALIGGASITTAVWAIRRWRSDRAEYERRLTAWAATEAVLAERLSIAGDLHDLVSHGLGLITVRAAATRHLLKPATPPSTPTGTPGVSAGMPVTPGAPPCTSTGMPSASAESPSEPPGISAAPGGPSGALAGMPAALSEMATALADIEETSRSATAELRRMLAVLREPSPAPRTPTEGLDALPEIVRTASAAGLRAVLTADPVGEVSPGVQVAVCRIVREGLANTARHAGPTDVTVRIHRDGSHVVVSVADCGPARGWRPNPGAGHGLAGLRERVTSLFGTLTATSVDGGFRLVARIPDDPPPHGRPGYTVTPGWS